jgi:hypothetical protein
MLTTFIRSTLMEALVASGCQAGVLFFDDFERASLLADPIWASSASGHIVADPLSAGHGGVLAFNNKLAGGDTFSVFQTPSGTDEFLSFDFLGLASPSGGYIGIDDPSETWIAGDPGTGVLNGVSPGSWRHFDVEFTASGNSIRLKLEQFVNAGGAPNQAFFDNIRLSDTGFAAAVPEPSTGVALALIALGLILRGWARSRADAS